MYIRNGTIRYKPIRVGIPGSAILARVIRNTLARYCTVYNYRSTTYTSRHCYTHTFMQTQLDTYIHANTTMHNWSWENIMGFEVLYAGRGRRNPVWSGIQTHWLLGGWIVKSAVDQNLWVRLCWVRVVLCTSWNVYELSWVRVVSTQENWFECVVTVTDHAGVEPRVQRPTPKPLGHKDTWTTQLLMVGWFVHRKSVTTFSSASMC